jgi:hypothetical protein
MKPRKIAIGEDAGNGKVIEGRKVRASAASAA